MIDTPIKLGQFISNDNIPEKNKYASYLCKAYYDYVQALKKFYGFSYAEILESINSELKLKAENEIKYEAFRSSLRRIEKIRGGTKSQVGNQKNNNSHTGVYNNEIASKVKDKTADRELSSEWLYLLKDHPVMKKETIQRAIDNGLTLEAAKYANDQGIRKFSEIVNKYCARKLN